MLFKYTYISYINVGYGFKQEDWLHDEDFLTPDLGKEEILFYCLQIIELKISAYITELSFEIPRMAPLGFQGEET